MSRALIIGGTGNQGGAAVRHLLKRGWQVRALVRDPGKPAAKDLSTAGAELVRGADGLNVVVEDRAYSKQHNGRMDPNGAPPSRLGRTAVQGAATSSGGRPRWTRRPRSIPS
jgi:uncharacterized protein YbjT (DUF2867 family)